MRDGVRLAADIYRPARDGKPAAGRFPTLLTRTPYNKDGASGEGRYYAERGYVVVANDVRGRYASEGTWRLIADDPAGRLRRRRVDRPAGLVRRQGRHVRHQLSRRHAARPGRDEPAAPDDDGPDRRRLELRSQRHAARRRVRAAVHELDLPDRSAQQQGGAGRPGPPAGAGRKRPADPPARRQPAGPTGNDSAARSSPSTRRGWSRRCRAGPNRRSGTSRGCRSSIMSAIMPTCPCLHITGWYDSWTRQVTMNYEALSKAKKSPQRLVIGPWVHGGQNSNVAGEVEFTHGGRHRPAGLPAALVRPLAAGREERRRRRPAGVALHHGHRRRPPIDGRPAPARRLLACRARMAARPNQADAALPERRRHALDASAPSSRRAATRPTRSTRSIRCRRSAAISRRTRA